MSTTGGRSPRDQGNRAERLVAKYLDGERVVGSGAYKFSNKNLLGDVDVYVDGRPYLKLEVKTTGRKHVIRGPYYTIPFLVLQQMQQEAEQYHQIGCLWIHFKGSSPDDDITVWPTSHLLDFMTGTGVQLMEVPPELKNGKSTPIYRTEILSRLLPGGLLTLNSLKLTVNVPTHNGDVQAHQYRLVLGQDVRYLLERKRGNV